MKKYEDFEGMVVSLILPQKFAIQTCFCDCLQYLYLFHCLSASQVYMIKERCCFSQIDFFVEYFPHRINVLFLSSQFLCHPRTQIRIILFDGVRRDIPNWKLFAKRALKRFSQIAFPMCEGGGDVVGILTPLVRGVAQDFHGDQVVELSVQLAVQEVEGKEEDKEGQVEVEDEKRLKEERSCMTVGVKLKNTLEPM